MHCLVGFMVHIITVSCPYFALRTTDNGKAAGRAMDCKGKHFLRIDDGRTKTGLNVTFKLPCKCLSLGLHYMLSAQYPVNGLLQRAHQMDTRHRRGMGFLWGIQSLKYVIVSSLSNDICLKFDICLANHSCLTKYTVWVKCAVIWYEW